ncbi:MAG: hypothetical protein M1832_006179 [Thelocarpon impressellum]|nr:MAG: hypothetical protein M1832_006179 [Thelocarpon impressellum]
MAQIRVPLFTGEGDDDIDVFIRICRLAFIPQERWYTDEDDRRDAELLMLATNLGGRAYTFYKGLPLYEKTDLVRLSNRLCARFRAASRDPYRANRALDEMVTLRQAAQPLQDYIARAESIAETLGDGYLDEVGRRMVEGLDDRSLHLATKRALGAKDFSFRDAACAMLKAEAQLVSARTVGGKGIDEAPGQSLSAGLPKWPKCLASADAQGGK